MAAAAARDSGRRASYYVATQVDRLKAEG